MPDKVKVPIKEVSGLFLGEDVDRKAFVGRLEEQYQGALEKSRRMQDQIELLEKKISELGKAQGNINDSMSGLQSKIAEIPLRAGVLLSGENSLEGDIANHYRLEVVNINPVTEPEAEGVYLPSGSFVRGTLLTGVYAPADQNNPLPVLIRLNEAFYGPNEARIPLSGAFVIGKAVGELNSERALVQAVTLSAVLPEGKEFTYQGNIGYVTDIYGELGIKGVVVRNTGAQMAASFMSGFLGGASEAVADGETTAVRSSSGRVARNVTGSVGRYAAFQGLSQSAAQLSKYYADQLNSIVPAVRVEAGVDVYLIVLEGVRINGLKINKPDTAHYLD
ncbi:MAG: TraB/VirB10 family protein [Candidatus Omnitrophica bacterium]|nr:TraB/VirB10 family protein [Candidatus Omnitrophota bacterium]